jgi:mono/diheme cytochrome c family protein
MKAFQLSFSICLVWFALTAAFAQTSPSSTSLTADPLYKKDCAKCHGKSADGRHFGGPSLISDKTAHTSAIDLRNLIANGKGRMPKFEAKLTPEEIENLVREIQALNRK